MNDAVGSGRVAVGSWVGRVVRNFVVYDVKAGNQVIGGGDGEGDVSSGEVVIQYCGVKFGNVCWHEGVEDIVNGVNGVAVAYGRGSVMASLTLCSVVGVLFGRKSNGFIVVVGGKGNGFIVSIGCVLLCQDRVVNVNGTDWGCGTVLNMEHCVVDVGVDFYT